MNNKDLANISFIVALFVGCITLLNSLTCVLFKSLCETRYVFGFSFQNYLVFGWLLFIFGLFLGWYYINIYDVSYKDEK